MNYQQLAKALDAEMYFTHPHASYEREHKWASVPVYPEGGLFQRGFTALSGGLNSRPRKCLGFRQPSVVFAELRKAA